MIGRIIKGTYCILEELGRGTVFTVQVARDMQCNLMVAHKIIHSDLAGEGQFTSRFMQEARLLSR